MKKKYLFIVIIIGLLGNIILSDTLAFKEQSVAYSNSMLSVILFFFSTILLYIIIGKLNFKDRRGVVLASVYSFALSFSLLVGKQLEAVGECEFASLGLWIKICFLAIFFSGYILFFIQTRGDLKEHEKEEEKKGKKWYIFGVWIAILLCWIPVFLAFYPGAFVYDAMAEHVQVETRNFSTHHPLLHVLLLGGIVQFGHKYLESYNAGIALYTILQMVFFSGVIASFIQYVLKNFIKGSENKSIIRCILVLFYGFFPIFPMYAVCSTKDTLFSAMLLLLIVQFMKILEKDCKSKRRRNQDYLKFILCSVATLLFRNNMEYVFIVFIGVLVGSLLYCRKKGNKVYKYYVKNILICMILSFLIFKGINGVLITALDAKDSGKQEIMTVPIQQLTRIHNYSKEVFSKEELEVLYSYIPMEALECYYAKCSDRVKSHFDNEKFSEDSREFFELWIEKGFMRPDIYINAWLLTSYGFWYPDAVINVYEGNEVFTFKYEDSSYFAFETEEPGIRDSKFLWLEEQYRKISLEIYQQKVPIISMLFSPGFMFWIFALCGGVLLYHRDYEKILLWGFLFLFWLTFLLGPTFLVRYVLFLWLILPIEIWVLHGKSGI